MVVGLGEVSIVYIAEATGRKPLIPILEQGSAQSTKQTSTAKHVLHCVRLAALVKLPTMR